MHKKKVRPRRINVFGEIDKSEKGENREKMLKDTSIGGRTK